MRFILLKGNDIMKLLNEEEMYLKCLQKGSKKSNVDGDIIVPDAKPDVLKVLQVDAKSVILDKGFYPKGIYAQGKVYINILYIPDCEEDGTYCINTSFEFKEHFDIPDLNEEMDLKILSDVVRVEFTLINSRKLNIKSLVKFDYEVFNKEVLCLPYSYDEGDLECMEDKIHINMNALYDECKVTIRDTLEIPSAKPSVKEIIKTDTKIFSYETKILPSKLVIKGILNSSILYITGDENVDCIEENLPFTEVFDIDNAQESDICNIDISVLDCSIDLSCDNDGDYRIISLNCLIGLNLTFLRNKEITYIKDCYCAGNKTDLSYNNIVLDEFIDYIKKEISQKELFETDKNLPEIVKIYNTVSEIEIENACAKDGYIIVSGKIKFYISYITDNPKCAVFSLKKEIPFEYEYKSDQAKEGMQVFAKLFISNIYCTKTHQNEIELKYFVSSEILVTKKRELNIICGLETSPITSCNDIVIYFVKNDENLWDIGKKYSIRQEDIIKLNNLESCDLKKGQKLLIPVK